MQSTRHSIALLARGSSSPLRTTCTAAARNGTTPRHFQSSRSFSLANQTRDLRRHNIPALSSVASPSSSFSRSLSTTCARWTASDAPSSGTSAPAVNSQQQQQQQSEQAQQEQEKQQQPAYELTFTCKPCSHRSAHRVSKQGYHKGTVLITCPSCKNRHVISDHLKIFSDKPMTIEDLMREKGQLVKKGSLGTDGDVEFWDDGTSTERQTQ
ncbi:zf-DNL-domain-containing protein [Xylona heveae TC161]|uniref:Zf-DNL-domain-containing protein n=1 Tax=Xylona heveae (strain CBS 132557 / TC161) TaxID=1328760 RepID=A0A165GNG1_XYLHT|nr:zf-DNL-domain-containing protein [Xylona heveae TC161]KZF22403.1 zf-DNL-domain-containing protein [Xylona heveae TC161]